MLQARAQALDVREIGEKLGAQYVLDGSVRRAGEQLRITAQLLKTQDRSQVWAKTYDRDANIAAVFEIQDQITTEIASMLAGTTGVIAKAEIASIKRKPPDKLQSYECVLLGHVYQQVWDEESHLAARDCLTRTVEDDPTFADAWAWLAHLHVDEAMWGFNPMDSGPDALTRAETAAKRALEEDRRNQKARLGLAAVHFARRDIVGFASEAEQALAINPNDADVLAEMAWRYAYAVDWKRGLGMMEKAMALNPLHPGWYHIAFFFDAYGRAEYAQALEAARKAEAPGNYLSYVMLAAVYGQLGRKTEASKALDALLKLYPDFQDHARDELESILIGNPEYVSRMLDGLRKAGLDVDTAGNLADRFSPKKITGVTVVTMLEGNVKGSGS
jgi:tetratricopeptide (TPR) repeat protein